MKDSEDLKIPKTVDEAIDQIISGICLEDRITLANLDAEQVPLLEKLMTAYIRSRLKIWNADNQLMKNCTVWSGREPLDETEAATFILEELWTKLRNTHRMKII